MRHTLLNRFAPAVAVGFTLLFAGCAGSNANRASRQQVGQVSYTLVREKADEFVQKISSNPRFTAMRERAAADDNPFVVALDMKIVNDNDTSGRFVDSIDEFKEVLSESFYNIDIGFFVDLTDASREERARRFDEQDFSDNFQTDGSFTTGEDKKQVIEIRAEARQVQRGIDNRGRPVFDTVIRANLYDGRIKAEFGQVSVVLPSS